MAHFTGYGHLGLMKYSLFVPTVYLFPRTVSLGEIPRGGTAGSKVIYLIDSTKLT